MTVVTEERIAEMAASLSETASSPEFLGMLEEIREAPNSEKMSVARDAIAELKRDVTLPEGFRLTTRTFEEPGEAVAYFDEEEGVGTVVYKGGIITVADKSEATTEAPAKRLSPEQIQAVIREGIEDIGRFVGTPEFKAVLDELYARPKDERPAYVADVILDPEQRAKRGISVPDDMIVQRSEFADARPTLFCVSKVLPLAYPWKKVTITFDSDE